MEQKKAIIEYPCPWQFKLIGRDSEQVQAAAASITADKHCIISYSNRSSSGKYHSWSVEIILESDEERIALYEAFSKHPAIRMVL